MSKRRICIDFDGVMNQYNGAFHAEDLGEPAEGLEQFLSQLHSDGFEIWIHTCRESAMVWPWLEEHGFKHLITGVSRMKVPATAYVDDRAICHRGSLTDTLEAIRTFEVWWRLA